MICTEMPENTDITLSVRDIRHRGGSRLSASWNSGVVRRTLAVSRCERKMSNDRKREFEHSASPLCSVAFVPCGWASVPCGVGRRRDRQG